MQEKIKKDMMEAMRAKDQNRVMVLRGLMAAFTNELVAKKRPPQESLTDEEALAVISRASKQRKDSIDQFKSGGRPELAETEENELKIINEYLPTLMGREEIKAFAMKKKDELGATDKSKAGMFMGTLMKELKGKADGADVKAVIDEIFS